MTGALVVQGDAAHLPLADDSVDLIVTSPPYFALRSYQDDGSHYAGQVGSEPTPREFLQSLWTCTAEWWRVLKPSGSLWLNLGDKYAGSGGHNNSALGAPAERAPSRYNQAADVPAKCLMGLPWRYAIGCTDGQAAPDGQQWVLRAEVVWCLSGGAKVYARTATGDRPVMIRDLVRAYQPDAVQLWNGTQWTQVLGWNRSAETDGALELELRSGERIGCTVGHQWPTARGLVRADGIRVGDVIATTRLPEPEIPRTPARLPDDDIGWLVGLYIAEGSRSGQMIQFAGHTKETARHLRLARIAATYDGRCAVYVTGDNTATCNLSGSVLIGIIDRYVSLGTARTKRLHGAAWQRSDAFLTAVMDGYLSGDGHYDAKNDRWRLGFTANDEWAADIRTLAARVGAALSLRRAVHHGFGQDWPGWKGEWRWMHTTHANSKDRGEVVAIRFSRARQFFDIGVADDPHTFALASGVLTHNSKPNGLPESVTDRVRRSHEQWFHLTKTGRYFTGMDEIRESYAPGTAERYAAGYHPQSESYAAGGPTLNAPARHDNGGPSATNALGKLPGSVWTIATEPLIIPVSVQEHYNLPSHFAAFPQEWPRRLILGWSPSGICTACGAGRRPVTVLTGQEGRHPGGGGTYREMKEAGAKDTNLADAPMRPRTITGYVCDCTPSTSHRGKRGDWKDGRELVPEQLADDYHQPGVSVPRRPGGFGTKVRAPDTPMIEYQLDGWVPPPTTPALILDPFGGTGTVSGVARALGRVGVSVDLSNDYCRLAHWRIFHSGHFHKTTSRTDKERQGALL